MLINVGVGDFSPDNVIIAPCGFAIAGIFCDHLFFSGP